MGGALTASLSGLVVVITGAARWIGQRGTRRLAVQAAS